MMRIRRRRYVYLAAGAGVLSQAYAMVSTPVSDSMLHTAGTVSAWVAAVSAWAFVALYSRGPWERSEYGHHMMVSTAVEGLIFTYVGVIATQYNTVMETHVEVVRFWVMSVSAAILAWRLRLLWKNVTATDSEATKMRPSVSHTQGPPSSA